MYLFLLLSLMSFTFFIYWIIIKLAYIENLWHILLTRDKKAEVLKYGHEKK